MGNQDYTYYGRVAYEAYREARGWESGDGSLIPEWDNTSFDTQQRWVAVGDAVVKAYTGEQ